VTLAILSGEQSHSGGCVFMPLAQPHAQITTMAMCMYVCFYLCELAEGIGIQMTWQYN